LFVTSYVFFVAEGESAFARLHPPTNVISTEGGAFAAAVERSLYFVFAEGGELALFEGESEATRALKK
jgi:hypothetical protein